MSACWVQHELESVRLGDKRLHSRLLAIVDTLAKRPEASIAEAFGNSHQAKAFYRFCSSDKVDGHHVLQAHRNTTVARAQAYARILAIQDTTSLDFDTHKATSGLGPIDAKGHQGMLVHSVMALTDTGLPLGMLQQFVWTRDPEKSGQHKQWRKRALTDKESRYFYFGLQDSFSLLPEEIEVVCVADRAGDFFDMFSLSRQANRHLLIRAAYDRCVSHEAKHLFAAAEAAPLAGTKTLVLSNHNLTPKREQVRLRVHFTRLSLNPPAYRKDLEAVSLQVVLAEEINPPEGAKPLRWLLLTSYPLTSFADACQILDWYAYRWLLERYHFVLKSGCHLEALQLSTKQRLQVALSLYSIVAWRLLYLTHAARDKPEQSCEGFLTPPEWQALYCVMHRSPVAPSEAPSLHDAVRWIARLGGFLARKSDGEPGVQVLWRGLRRLADIAETWSLLHGQSYG
jgi:Transposase DNA-binding/Transposase Tn5 dimerisation domain